MTTRRVAYDRSYTIGTLIKYLQKDIVSTVTRPREWSGLTNLLVPRGVADTVLSVQHRDICILILRFVEKVSNFPMYVFFVMYL